MRIKILALLVALLGATTGAVAQDDISLGYIIGNGRLLGAKTADGQTTVGILGIDSNNNTVVKSLSGADVLFPSNLKIANNTYLQARNAAGSADIDVIKIDATDDTLINSDASDTIKLQIGGDANRLFTFDASSDTALTLKFGDAGTTAAQTLTISSSTSDADDDSVLFISAGGAASQTRGSGVFLYGNEAGGTPGELGLVSGALAGADIIATVQDDFIVRDFAAASSLTIDVTSKAATFGGTVTSTATSDLGWSAVNAPNQACNTTCTSACVFGMNTGALGNFVGCADATADTCICAGAS